MTEELIGAGSMACPNCRAEMIREGTGIGCHKCGMYIGPGPGGNAGVELLTKMTMPPNPLMVPFRDIEEFQIQKGSRVGFERDGVIITGIVTSYDVNKETGVVTITMEDNDP
jgi:hypothetical protein